MKKIGFWRVGLLACAAAVLVQGCGSGSSNDGHVRLINATSTHTGLDLYDGTTQVESNIAIGSASSYADISSGSPVLSVDDTGSTTAIASFTPTLSNSTHYAVLSYESNGGVYFSIINEEVTAPASGSAQLAIRNFTYDAGSLDIYLTAANATTVPASAAPTYISTAPAALGSQAATVGGTVTPNQSYAVIVTAHGSKSDIRLIIPSITIADQSVNSIVLTPAVGGILVNGALLVQQGTYTPFANTAARVKLVNGLSSGSNVVSLSATSGTVTTPIDTSGVNGSTGGYVTVPNAASATLSATYAGATVALSPTGVTLSPGADYTVLVSGGGATAPTATVLTDDNHLPLVQGNAKLRLVNGYSNAGALTVVVDSVTPATNVGLGTASAYTEVVGDNAAQINVTAQLAVAAGTSSNICQNLLYPTASSTVRLTGLTTNSTSGGVYSLYILGDNTTVTTTSGGTTTSAPTSLSCQLRLER